MSEPPKQSRESINWRGFGTRPLGCCTVLLGLFLLQEAWWLLWRVIVRKKREDDNHKLIEIVSNGALPVSREFILNNPQALLEMIQIQASQAARVEIEKARQIELPALTTFSPTTSYAPTNDKELIQLTKSQDDKERENDSQGVGDGEKK